MTCGLLSPPPIPPPPRRGSPPPPANMASEYISSIPSITSNELDGTLHFVRTLEAVSVGIPLSLSTFVTRRYSEEESKTPAPVALPPASSLLAGILSEERLVTLISRLDPLINDSVNTLGLEAVHSIFSSAGKPIEVTDEAGDDCNCSIALARSAL